MPHTHKSVLWAATPLSLRGYTVMLTQHDTQIPVSSPGRWPGVFGLCSRLRPWPPRGNKKPLFHNEGL